ncbi:MAG: hypothetical protein NTV06_06430 [candidate division Zixibacteria bacterium]|nr:hypothetical protein [candidate division Zixibacteria bacterium]
MKKASQGWRKIQGGVTMEENAKIMAFFLCFPIVLFSLLIAAFLKMQNKRQLSLDYVEMEFANYHIKGFESLMLIVALSGLLFSIFSLSMSSQLGSEKFGSFCLIAFALAILCTGAFYVWHESHVKAQGNKNEFLLIKPLEEFRCSWNQIKQLRKFNDNWGQAHYVISCDGKEVEFSNSWKNTDALIEFIENKTGKKFAWPLSGFVQKVKGIFIKENR